MTDYIATQRFIARRVGCLVALVALMLLAPTWVSGPIVAVVIAWYVGRSMGGRVPFGIKASPQGAPRSASKLKRAVGRAAWAILFLATTWLAGFLAYEFIPTVSEWCAEPVASWDFWHFAEALAGVWLVRSAISISRAIFVGAAGWEWIESNAVEENKLKIPHEQAPPPVPR